MTWSISISAANKDEAKRRTTEALGRQMLGGSVGYPNPHARDFQAVLAAAHGAIDACEEGVITVSGSGYLNGDWVGGDIPKVRGVSITLSASSVPAEDVKEA